MKEIFASGLQQIAIGVYDLRLLREVVPGIAELIKIKNQRGLKIPKTYLDITICEKSFPYIQNFIQTAHEIGINALIFHRLFNVYKTDPSVKYISSAKEKMLFANIKEMATKMGMEIYLPARHSYPCKVVRYSIFVTVDGEITPCCFYNTKLVMPWKWNWRVSSLPKVTAFLLKKWQITQSVGGVFGD